ncbi:unnamed protein product, partial [Discosporangium mesarthrocarpum]
EDRGKRQGQGQGRILQRGRGLGCYAPGAKRGGEGVGNMDKLRLKKAMEDLGAREAHPAIRWRLLNQLLAKARRAYRAALKLSESRADLSSAQERGSLLVEATYTIDDARGLLRDEKRETRFVSV